MPGLPLFGRGNEGEAYERINNYILFACSNYFSKCGACC
jgi:hypothetical protein